MNASLVTTSWLLLEKALRLSNSHLKLTAFSDCFNMSHISEDRTVFHLCNQSQYDWWLFKYQNLCLKMFTGFCILQRSSLKTSHCCPSVHHSLNNQDGQREDFTLFVVDLISLIILVTHQSYVTLRVHRTWWDTLHGSTNLPTVQIQRPDPWTTLMRTRESLDKPVFFFFFCFCCVFTA